MKQAPPPFLGSGHSRAKWPSEENVSEWKREKEESLTLTAVATATIVATSIIDSDIRTVITDIVASITGGEAVSNTRVTVPLRRATGVVVPFGGTTSGTSFPTGTATRTTYGDGYQRHVLMVRRNS